MKQFLYAMNQMFGFMEAGLSSMLYSLYLKITKKLPYEVEMSIKPEARQKFIKMESTCLLLQGILGLSMFSFLHFSLLNDMYIVLAHFFVLLIILIYQSNAKRSLYYETTK